MPDSVRRYGQQPSRLLCPRDFLGKNSGVVCHFLLQPTPLCCYRAPVWVPWVTQQISHWLFIPLSLFNTSDKRSSSLLPTVLSALTEWGSFADWKLSKYMEQTLTQEEGGVYGLLRSHTSLLGKCKGKVSRATILDSKLHAVMVNLMCELG